MGGRTGLSRRDSITKKEEEMIKKIRWVVEKIIGIDIKYTSNGEGTAGFSIYIGWFWIILLIAILIRLFR